MGLKFTRLEPVEFGDPEHIFQPVVDPAMRKRLEMNAGAGDNDKEELLENIARCFPEHEDYVRKFLHEQCGSIAIGTLQAYLTNGDDGLRAVNRALDAGLEKVTKL